MAEGVEMKTDKRLRKKEGRRAQREREGGVLTSMEDMCAESDAGGEDKQKP